MPEEPLSENQQPVTPPVNDDAAPAADVSQPTTLPQVDATQPAATPPADAGQPVEPVSAELPADDASAGLGSEESATEQPVSQPPTEEEEDGTVEFPASEENNI